MYTLSIQRDFIAQHFLIGGDWGPENFKHSHHYVLAVELEGEMLDQHGYLVDIVDLEKRLEGEVAYFRDQLLNDLPEFAGLNPSIEHFTRICWQRLTVTPLAENITALTVKIWENEIAWASYRQGLQ